MRLLCSTDRLIRSVRWSRCSARFKVGAIQNHPLPPTMNLCLLLGLHRPGAFNLAPLGPSNKIYVISSSFTGCRFNHLRAIVELTAPSASSGAQSAGTISKHLDNPPPTSCMEARAPWEQLQQEADLIVTVPTSVTCVFWLRTWIDFSFFLFFHQHLLFPHIGNVRGRGHAIPYSARVRQRGAAVSFHALSASLE